MFIKVDFSTVYIILIRVINLNIDKCSIKNYYEIEKLKAKLNLSADIAKIIDEKLLKLSLEKNSQSTAISDDISNIRNELRDLIDFLKEN